MGRSKDFAFAICTNLLSTLASAFITLLLPKSIPVENNGYFQLFLFYAGYVGLLHVGWPDGFYLVKCGAEYSSLDRRQVWGQLKSFIFFQLILSVIISAGSLLLVPDADKKVIFFFVGIMTIISNLRIFLLYILQATARIRDYSIATIVGLVAYILLVSIFMLLKITDYVPYIIANIASVFLPLLWGLYYNRDLLFKGPVSLKESFGDTKMYVGAGFKLLIANVASSFIIGVMRWAIEYQWDVSVFGKISITITISNMFMTLINAIALVLLPMLRRMNQDKIKPLYKHLNIVLLTSIFVGMILYYPVQFVLVRWLPDYADSLIYMALLLPICVFESKNALILNTYLKALRKENMIMLINVGTVALSAVLSCVSVFFLKNITLSMGFVVVALAFRCVISEVYLSRTMGVKVGSSIVMELLLSVLFVVFNWGVGGPLGLVLYCLVIAGYVLINNRKIKESYQLLLKG